MIKLKSVCPIISMTREEANTILHFFDTLYDDLGIQDDNEMIDAVNDIRETLQGEHSDPLRIEIEFTD